MPVLVLGATGRQGGAVTTALLRSGWPVRALVRNASSSAALKLSEAGVKPFIGTFSEPTTLQAAMSGAHGVFSMLPSNLTEDDEVRFGISIADTAADSGVAHLVYSSGGSVGETPTGIARFDAKPRIEAHIRKLNLCATIIRPMIFMDMLVRPGYGLDEGRYAFFLKPDQAIQIVATDDIGKIVAVIFEQKERFAGKTIKIASDTITGSELQTILGEAAGHHIRYERFSETFLAQHPDLQQMSKSLEDGPLAAHADLNFLREINPELMSFRSWLKGPGRATFADTLGIR